MAILNKKSNNGKGILDFEQKFKLLQQLTGKDSFSQAIEAVIKNSYPEYCDGKVSDIVGAARKWKASNPKSSRTPKNAPGKVFLSCLEDYLLTREYIADDASAEAIDYFCNKSIDAFSKFINPNSSLQDLNDYVDYPEDPEQLVLYVNGANNYPSPKDLITTRKIDQKLCYMSPQAPGNWDLVTQAIDYKQFDACKSALNKMLNSPEWINYCKEKGPDGVVCLGAGSAQKDVLILESIIKHTTGLDSGPLHYSLVDSSSYMLSDTLNKVKKSLYGESRRTIETNGLNKDFNCLKKWKELRRQHRNVAWFINGGTIGNIEEKAFFKSIASQSNRGDLLSISIDTLSDDVGLSKETDLKSRYDKKYIRDLIKPSLSYIWPELNIDKSFQQTLKDIKYQYVEGQLHSDVYASRSVEFSIRDKNHDKIVLLTSTRYKEEYFVKFARDFGFSHKFTSYSKGSGTQKIVSFEFIGL